MERKTTEQCRVDDINNVFYDDLEEKWYEADDHPIALLRAENAARTPWVIEQIQSHFSNPCTALDIGCGGGFLTNALARVGHRVTGVDLSAQSLAVAQRKDETHSVKYLEADAYKLPFPDQQFDVVSAMDFLEHVEKPDAIITEASRVLKPGGLFFYHTFNRTFLSWLVVLKGVEWFVRNTPRHMHVFRLFLKPSEVEHYCSLADLQVVSCQGLIPDIQRKAFWQMLFTGRVSSCFSFRQTQSLSCGYMGYAKKRVQTTG